MQYGPWPVGDYTVSIAFAGGVHLVVARGGLALRGVPEALRGSGDYAWIRLALEAARGHYRDLRRLLENAMVESIPLSAEDLAFLALDPAGRCMLEMVLLETAAAVGRALPDEWLLETALGDLCTLQPPATVVHPLWLEERGELQRWNSWLNRAPVRQPFKQVRRETYLPDDRDRTTGSHSERFAGETVRWDQSRALLEGRGWRHVTKTGAERCYERSGLRAFLEFRTPASRGFSREDVVLNRVYFLEAGVESESADRPGMDVERVSPTLFSETLRDVALVARVAGYLA